MVFRRLLATLGRGRTDESHDDDGDDGDDRSAGEMEALIASLRDPAAQERPHASEALTAIGESPVFLPALLSTAYDADAYLREAAMYALGRYPLDRRWRLRGAVLVALRDDVSPAVRAAAATALQSCTAKSLRGLRRALNDADPSVRCATIETLARADDEHALDDVADRLLNDTEPSVREVAATAVGSTGDETWIDALVQAFDDADAGVRTEAVHQAWMCSRDEHVHPEVVPHFVRMLRDPSPRVRQMACKPLIWESPEAVPELTRALGDTDPEVRREAARALGLNHANDAVAALAAMMSTDPDLQVREEAASALGHIASEEAVRCLIAHDPTGSEGPGLRAARLEAMGNTSSEAVLAPLCEALGDANADIRRAAATGIQRLSAFGKFTPEAVAAAVPALCDAALKPDEEVRKDAIEGLGHFKHPGALPTLLKLARHRDEEVRASACEALGQMESPEVENTLIQGLKDRSKDVQEAAAKGLARAGAPARWRELIPHVTASHKGARVRAHLAEALAKTGTPEAHEALQQVMNDPDEFVREAICSALQNIERPTLLPGLLDRLDDDEERVRAQAALAIAAVDDPRGFEALKRRLADEPSPFARRRIVWGLSFYSRDDCLPLLIERLSDDGELVRHQAVRALGELLSADELRDLVKRLPRRTPADARKGLADADGADRDAPMWHRKHRWVVMGSVHYE